MDGDEVAEEVEGSRQPPELSRGDALLRDAERWLDAELTGLRDARADAARRVAAKMWRRGGESGPTFSASVFDVRLAAPTHEMRKVAAVLPNHPSPGIVDVPLDDVGGCGGDGGTSAYARELSVYDQQRSTLTGGKSGREGGVATRLEFLPGGLARSVKQVAANAAAAEGTAAGAVGTRPLIGWDSLDEIALRDTCSSKSSTAVPISDDDARKLAAAGVAPGLFRGLSVEDVQAYLTSLSADASAARDTTARSPDDDTDGASKSAAPDDDQDIDALNRNSPQLLGRYDGAIQDPEFHDSVRANLRWEGTKEAESRAGDTVSFSNIFADLDEEDYLLGDSSSSSDSSSGSDDDDDVERDVDVSTSGAASEDGGSALSVASSGTSTTTTSTAAAAPAAPASSTTDAPTAQADDMDEITALLLETQQKLETPPTVNPFGDGPTRWKELVPNMAMKYPFELDSFQKQAVVHLERGEFVFVAAHTSAGKTVVAEYAIALAFKHRTRVVYTSPIKALSNQKFRDFREKFDDVGIITGDVSVNPDATCLVMTTEILRSMLYRGADLIRDIEWVVFDEVHYVNDTERGVVWEEVIIMLPQHVKMIFLSATTPNMVEFSEWIGRTKQREVHVISTPKRPIPLEHSLYHDKKRYVVMDEKGHFLNNGYRKVANLISGKDTSKPTPASKNKARNRPTGRGGKGRGPAKGAGGNGKRGGRRRGGADKSQWTGLIRMLQKDDLLPVVIFSFSKKVCMGSARVLQNMDLTTAKEKSKIHVFCQNAILRLGESDRGLPQVTFMLKLLRHGIGVHTGGLLPIVKEIVEILFSRGLVRVLFATETFAMGVNMPARTVLFNGTRKHDGVSFRDLLPGEYTQMSGRAGRRGLDSVGTVLVAAWGDKLPEVTDLHHMLKGRATKLSSQFRLTYTMILILLRVEDMSVEEMIKRSFSEFSTQHLLGSRDLPQLADKIRRCLDKLERGKANLDGQQENAVGDDSASPTSTADAEGMFTLIEAENAAHTSVLSWLGCGSGGRFDALLIPPGRLVVVRTAMPGRIMLNNSLAIVVQAGSARDGTKKKKQTGNTPGSIVVCALCPKGTVLPGSATVHDMGDSESSFMPGTYRRLTDESLGGGGRLLAMVEVTYLKLVRICAEGLDPAELIDTAASNVGAKNMSASSRRISDSGFGSGMVAMGKKKGGNDMMMMGSFGKKSKKKNKKTGGAVSAAEPQLRQASGRGAPSSSAFSKSKVDPKVAATAFAKVMAGDAPSVSCVAKRLITASVPLKDTASLEQSLPRAVDFDSELNIKEMDFVESCRRLAIARAEIEAHPVASSPQWPEKRVPIERESRLREKLRHIERVLSDENLDLFPDFTKKLGILRALEYTSDADVVQLKGRVACEVNTCDELVLTELVFENVLEPLSCEEAVALLSAFVFQQRTDDAPELNDNLNEAQAKLVGIAQSLAAVQMDHGLEIDPIEYVKDRLNFGMVHVVYEWARGVPFSEICTLTAVEEGTIVRCISRLDETCREVRNVARVIGDPGLYQKMEEASERIKRDIVFATSLYL